MRLIFILMATSISKIAVFGSEQPNIIIANSSVTRDVLLWFVIWWHYWPIFFEDNEGRDVTATVCAIGVCWLFLCGNQRRKLGWRVIPARRCDMQHKPRNNWSSSRTVRKFRNQPFWWYDLATVKLRFKSAGLYFVRKRESQIHIMRMPKQRLSTWRHSCSRWWDNSAYFRKCTEKLREQNWLRQVQPSHI